MRFSSAADMVSHIRARFGRLIQLKSEIKRRELPPLPISLKKTCQSPRG